MIFSRGWCKCRKEGALEPIVIDNLDKIYNIYIYILFNINTYKCIRDNIYILYVFFPINCAIDRIKHQMWCLCFFYSKLLKYTSNNPCDIMAREVRVELSYYLSLAPYYSISVLFRPNSVNGDSGS